jgi:HEAT repeat protein
MYGWSPLPRTLAAALRDVLHAEARVRLSAVADLERLCRGDGHEAAVAALIAALSSDKDLEVRAAAALALADARAEDGLGALLRAAEHDEPRVRQLALVAVGELAGRDHVDAQRVIRLGLSEAAPALRFQALLAASHVLAERELVDVLVDAQRDEEPRVRYLTCRLLEQLPLEQSEDTTRSRVVRALEALFQDDDSEIRLSAAVALAQRGSRQAREQLVVALNAGTPMQPDDEQAAIELCSELSLRDAFPGLRERAWGRWYKAKSPFVFQARVALARLGDARARQDILKGLSSWSRPVRTRSAVAAGLAGLQEARARLVAMQSDERQADSYSVAEALRALDAPART